MTLRRICSTFAVHTKDFELSLSASTNWSMVSIKSATLAKALRRIALLVISANQRSMRLSHEELVGVKFKWNRRCFLSHALTLGWLCVP